MKKYEEIYENLREDIKSGAYGYGKKLPSKRVIAESKGASLITVEHALDMLESEGYIEGVERSGYFVVYRGGETFEGEESVIAVESLKNIDDEPFPLSVLTSEMRSAILELGERLLIKSPPSGIKELKIAIKNYLRRNRGVEVEESQIIVGSGAEYLYGMIVELLGKEVYAVESPSYKKIEKVYLSRGKKVEYLPLGREGIPFKYLKESRAEVLHVTPYRSYPTGVTASASKKREYLAWANEGDRYIVEDDYESEFSLTGKMAETIFSLGNGGRVIYVNTFSKTVSPALRVGYMLLPKELVEKFEKNLGFYSCSVPVFEQYLIARLLSDGAFERHLNKVRRIRRKKEG